MRCQVSLCQGAFIILDRFKLSSFEVLHDCIAGHPSDLGNGFQKMLPLPTRELRDTLMVPGQILQAVDLKPPTIESIG